MADKYDLVVSLGSMPITSELLREKELQLYDFPFDRIFGGNFYTRMNMFLLDCCNFMEQKNISMQKDTPTEGMVQYKDLATGFIYPYDFNPNLLIESNFPAVKMRYDKYIKNLKICLKAAKKILLVYVENPQMPEDDDETSHLIMEASQQLKEKYPKKSFHILYAKNDEDIENIKVIQLGKDAEKIAFNFYRKFSDMSSYYIDKTMLETFLTDIKLKTNWRQKKMFLIQKLINMLN